MPAHRIVAIDYDAKIGERLRAAFAPPEFDFHWFAAGREALENLQDLQPEAIICDVMLPDIDGRAVLDAVKRSPGLRDVPFLVLSAVRSEVTIRATLDAGADAFLLKPFPVSQLVQTIRKVLRDTPDQGAGAPLGELPRSAGSSPGLAAVGRTGRKGASLPSSARAPAREATSRQRIGFETRDPLPGALRPEPPPVPLRAGQAPPSREDASPNPPEAGEAEDAAPIRLEGRMSSLEIDGARIRIITAAEQGRNLVVKTTVARDGNELRSIETKVDRSPESGADERSLRELIDLQHAGALQEISRLLTPAPRRPEEPLLPDQPEERTKQEVPPVARGAASEEPADARTAPAESLPVGRKRARRSADAAPRKAAEAKPRARRRARPQPPPSVDTVVLKRAVEADPVAPERDAIPEPERPSSVAPAPGQADSAVKRPWLLASLAAVAIAAGILLEDPPTAPPAAKAPEPSLKAAFSPDTSSAAPTAPEPSLMAASSPDTSSAAPTPPIAQESKPAGEVRQPAPVSRPSSASLERIVRGRREWAQALYEAGRYEEASMALREVFKLAPSDPEARRLAAAIARTPRALDSPGSDEAPLPPRRPAEAPAAARESAPPPSERGLAEQPTPDRPAARGALALKPVEEPGSVAEALRAEEPAKARPKPWVERGALLNLADPGVEPPIAESKPPLAYPELALRQRVEGTVELRALVDEAGAVTDALVLSALSPKVGLGEAAVDYVKRWTFRPARKDGVAVKVWVPVEVEFRLPR